PVHVTLGIVTNVRCRSNGRFMIRRRRAPTAVEFARMTPRTASELLTLSVLVGLGADPRFQPANAATADRNGVVIASGHLHQFAIAVSPMSNHSVDVDNVAAVDANKSAFVEPRFDFADSQGAKQFEGAIEDIRVVGIGVYCDHVFNAYEMCRAVALNRQVVGDARWRAAGTSERRIGSPAELRLIAISTACKDWSNRYVRISRYRLGHTLLSRALGYQNQQKYPGHTKSDHSNNDSQKVSRERRCTRRGHRHRERSHARHGGIVHPRNRNAERHRGQNYRRAADPAGRQPKRQSGCCNCDNPARSDI